MHTVKVLALTRGTRARIKGSFAVSLMSLFNDKATKSVADQTRCTGINNRISSLKTRNRLTRCSSHSMVVLDSPQAPSADSITKKLHSQDNYLTLSRTHSIPYLAIQLTTHRLLIPIATLTMEVHSSKRRNSTNTDRWTLVRDCLASPRVSTKIRQCSIKTSRGTILYRSRSGHLTKIWLLRGLRSSIQHLMAERTS